MEAKIEPLADGLTSIAWRWDPETDILSGSFKGNRKSGGLTGSIELTDAEGEPSSMSDAGDPDATPDLGSGDDAGDSSDDG